MEYHFNDESLRIQALTHRSAGSNHNERLEFLGDALLGSVVAEYLFENFPHADEGQLTRTRASLVNRESLADVARTLDLGNVLVLGEGEQKSGGWRRDSILGNALEALVGAVYLDGGMDACRRVVEVWFADKLAEIDPVRAAKDPKTALQELLQRQRYELPRYETTGVSGPSHDQTFTVSCYTDALTEPVIAIGRSRRKAEQAAARAALNLLNS